MISAMPAVAVRRERKKHQLQRAASSNSSSLSSLPSPSTRSSSLASSPLSQQPNYAYFSGRHRLSTASTPGSTAPGGRPASSVSTISSAASNYVSALHRVRERRLETQRERARFLVYTGSVLLASGAALVVIGLSAGASAAQTVGLLFLCLGCAFCLARVFCLQPEEMPRLVVRKGLYLPPASLQPQSNVTTPGTDDSSTTSSYYFSAVPLHRLASPTTPTTPAPPPPLQPPPPPVSVAGAHRAHSVHSNPSSILTPMSLNSIPEMQVLITDDSQRY